MQHHYPAPPLSTLKRLSVKVTLAAALLSSAFTGIAAAEDKQVPTPAAGSPAPYDIVVITGANGLARRELEVRTEDAPPAAGVEATMAALYASSDNTVTNAVYSQQIGSHPNSSVNSFHIPASASHLLVQFNQELAPDQEGLQVFVNDSLLPGGSVQVLPDRILALNLSQVTSGREAVIKITHLKITGGQLKANPVTVYIYKES